MAGSDPRTSGVPRSYSDRPRRSRWLLLGVIGVLHVAGLYFLAQTLVPEMGQSLPREVVAAFQIDASPPPPPPPENRSEPDEGAQGEPGERAEPAPVTAPPARLPPPDPTPRPRVAASGTAPRSGARESGEGTGAAGEGLGTGSGNQGDGAGGVAVTRPRHISGEIDNARDYPTPPGGRAVRRGTEVIVRVIVTPAGRARDCSIHRPSPDPEADRITCELVVARLGFEPARDAAGNPVEAPFYWRQRWF